MKGVVYYDNFNCIVNRSPDIPDCVYCMWLDGANSIGRCYNRNLDHSVDCESNKKEEQ